MYSLHLFVPLQPICTKTDMSELVSVIMPTYNSSQFLAGSIDSILAQTYQNFELLIADDCSTDDTTRLLMQYQAKDPRVKVFYNKEGNKGAGYTRNKCIENAQGRYIAFCDSDDRWTQDKLEKQVRFMREKCCRLSYTSYTICDDNDNDYGIFIAPKQITFGDILKDNKIGCLTAMYDVEELGKIFYMPTIRKRQDWALFMMILRQCKVAYGIEEPLAYYRVRSNSISRSKLALMKYNAKVYQEVLKYGKFKSYAFLCTFFIPTYTLKVIKRSIDSLIFRCKKKK